MASTPTTYLSLNGTFDYPIELKKDLTVDANSEFNGTIVQGGDNIAENKSFVSGDKCEATGEHSLAVGIESHATADYSRADGKACSAEADYSRAYGAYAKAVHENSFIWSGTGSEEYPYETSGNGTFCIRPLGQGENAGNYPERGFYIGNYTLPEHISSYSAARILENPNAFAADQTFSGSVTFQNPVNARSQFDFGTESNVNFYGDTFVLAHNDVAVLYDKHYAASVLYARGVALSAVTAVGDYYQNSSQVDFDAQKNFAVSLGFVDTYVTSSIQNPEAFYGTVSNDGIPSKYAASRKYASDLATWASTAVLTSDNTFTGKNVFNNLMISRDGGKITLSRNADADFKEGNVMVAEPAINDKTDNVPATVVFARNVATSGVYEILHKGNTYGIDENTINKYKASSQFNGPVEFSKRVVLGNNASVDFTQGTLRVKEPNDNANAMGEPSTTHFTRNVALSAVNGLLDRGGTFSKNSKVAFNGTLTFNTTADFTSDGANVYVKTQRTDAKASNLAASTEYVERYVTSTVSTSAKSVKGLVVESSAATTNNFTTTNNFLHENIFVSTMNVGTRDNHAASCEFVAKSLDTVNLFDLFEMKYMDYELDSTTSRWRLSGSTISKRNFPIAYNQILDEYRKGTAAADTYGTAGSQTSIPYRRARNGHKIVLSSEEGNRLDVVLGLTGTAWYYVLDVNNETVRLPRTIYGFNVTNSTSDVGDYIKPSLPSHTHALDLKFSSNSSTGPYPNHGGPKDCNHSTEDLQTGGAVWNADIGTGSTVQPPATKVFLYFYCG